jgi:hypothetical protein
VWELLLKALGKMWGARFSCSLITRQFYSLSRATARFSTLGPIPEDQKEVNFEDLIKDSKIAKFIGIKYTVVNDQIKFSGKVTILGPEGTVICEDSMVAARQLAYERELDLV